MHKPVAGTPQGGVVFSTNLEHFSAHVLDLWFENVVKPRIHGECRLVRFADDFVLTFEDRPSGKRVLDVLGKRLGRFGLSSMRPRRAMWTFAASAPTAALDGDGDDVRLSRLHPRMGTVETRQGCRAPNHGQGNGSPRALKSVHDWCKRHRHLPIIAQRDHLALMIRGHFGILRSFGEQQTIGVVPLPGHSNLAGSGLLAATAFAYELGPDECTAQAIPLAFSTDRASMARSCSDLVK